MVVILAVSNAMSIKSSIMLKMMDKMYEHDKQKSWELLKKIMLKSMNIIASPLPLENLKKYWLTQTDNNLHSYKLQFKIGLLVIHITATQLCYP